MNHNELNLFSIPLNISYCSFFNDIKDDLIKNILDLSEKQLTNIDSQVAPYLKNNLKESKFDLHKQNIESIDRILTWIKEEIEELNYKLSNINLKCNIIESWYHVTEYSGYHGTHTHTNCSWCAIFYVEPGDSGGFNIFQSRENTGYIDPGYYWWSDMIKIQPEPGKLVLFPSMLMHSAEPYLGENKKRIVISCNTTLDFKE